MDRVRPTFYASRLDFSLDFIPEIPVLSLSYPCLILEYELQNSQNHCEPESRVTPRVINNVVHCKSRFMDLHPEAHQTHRHAVNPQNTSDSLSSKLEITEYKTRE